MIKNFCKFFDPKEVFKEFSIDIKGTVGVIWSELQIKYYRLFPNPHGLKYYGVFPNPHGLKYYGVFPNQHWLNYYGVFPNQHWLKYYGVFTN